MTLTKEDAKSFLARVATAFAAKPFKPHPAFRSGNAQTLAGWAWPRSYRLQPRPQDEDRLFDVAPGAQVLAHCRWQAERRKYPTVVIWHGMEGSAQSIYMIASADKMFRAGFNVVRVNYRNCGGTEHLSPTLYHGGLSSDLQVVINQLIENDGLKQIFVLGFSLGGNMVLKLVGEYGENAPPEVVAACVISPSVDLQASVALIMNRRNWLYHKQFMRSLKSRIRLKQRLFPDVYDLSRLPQIRNLLEFDEEFTSVGSGFLNASDYYFRASAIRVVANIRIPTLLIHAKDDPFIPFDSLTHEVFSENPYIMLVATERGGHVAFISSRTDEDRFWAENRAVEFFQLANAHD
jgi:hypothetical protein